MARRGARGRRVRWWVAGGVALVLVALALGAWAWSWSRGGLPQRSGTARIPGLSASVRVRFDAFGVPHVDARSARDLFAALGWLHANDRLFQLELGRRAAAGRLSEVLGEAALLYDEGARRLRLREAAEAALGALEPESREAVEAYASGVNAWLERRAGDLPPEFRVFGIVPAPWKPLDSLAFHVLMAQNLTYHGLEQHRAAWLDRLGERAARELIGDPDLRVPPGTLGAASANLPSERGPSGGSNNFAIGPSRSAQGGALVGNDPHLGLSLPGTWYQAALRSPEYEAAGMTLPGLPLVVIGQTREIAWSFTNTEADLSDLWLEEHDPARETVRRGTEWVQVVVAPETIPTKESRGRGPGREIVLRSTERGPLLLPPETGLSKPCTLRWTAYEPFDPIAPFLRLARARRVEDVPAAVASFVCPVQNMVAADRRGSLLFTILGRTPERGAGDGRLPMPGWDPAYEWRGLRPQEENPLVLGPEEDLLATANDDVRPAGYAKPLQAEFAPPHRARRIRERLRARTDWTPEALSEVQGDLVSLYALEVVSLLPERVESEPARRALEALRGWDGSMELRGPSALYGLLEHQLAAEIFGDELSAEGLPPLGFPEREAALIAALQERLDESWYDDVSTPEREGRSACLERALARAWERGLALWGGDAAAWRWGEIHELTLASHPLARLPIAGALFRRGPFEVPGSATCPRVLTGPWVEGGVEVNHGASMRWIADLLDPDRSLAVLPGGQSGHPFDRHFDDQIEPFLAGRSRAVAWSEGAVAAATVSELELAP